MGKSFQFKAFGKKILELRSGDSEPGTFSLSDLPGDFLSLFGGNKTKSDQIVNQQTAIGFSAVTAGVRIISETIASLSFNVHRQLGGGNQEIARTHPVQELIHTSPFHLYTSFVFRETLVTYAIMWGNGYARIHRNGLNGILGYEILHANQVTPFLDKEGFVWYKVTGLADPIFYLDMIHIHGFTKNGIIGLALTDIAKESIGSGLAMQELASKFFANGGIFKGILTTPQALKKDQYDRIKTSWRENTGSDDHWHEPLLEGGLEYKPMTLSPEQSQLLESRKFQLIEVARVLRIPPHKLGDLSKSTNNNIEHQSIEFVTDTIRPWAKRIEGEFNRKSFKESEKGILKTRLDLNSLLRGDITARGEFYSKQFNIGAMSPNDIRKKEGLNTYEGGDEYYVQGAYIPVSIIKKKYQADVAKIISETKKQANAD